MKLLGFEITRTKQVGLTPVYSGSHWWPLIQEWTTSAWQSNAEIRAEDTLGYWAVFRCISMISADIGKMDLRLMEKDADGIWTETESPAFSPVLLTPNHFQNTIQFVENWLQSKLARGNTYVLKERDARNVVTSLFVLDPALVTPMRAEGGEVFYRINRDNVSGTQEPILVPDSEIIHDRFNCFYDPLVGLSPLYASAITALMGKRIQDNSIKFFANGSIPSGVLSAPGLIPDATALRLKQYWEANYSGTNIGKVAVLGDGLKYEAMRMTSTDAQLIEQLNWTDARIAGAFGVPAYMLNAGTAPAYNNVEALALQYFQQSLQPLIVSLQRCLDDGLGLMDVPGKIFGARFDLDDLLRMDTSTMVATLQNAVKGILTTNEARKKIGYGPKDGADEVLTQQQNVSVKVAGEQEIKPQPAPQPQQPQPSNDNEDAQAARAWLALRKGFGNA